MQGQSNTSFFRITPKLKLLAASLLTIGISACGGGSSDKPVTSTPTPPVEATTANIQGKILLPDGSTPLSNATVYIQAYSGSNPAGLHSKANNRTCIAPTESYLAYTCTGGDGTFSLEGLNKDSYEVFVSKGAFNTSFLVDTTNVNGDSYSADPVALDTDLQNGSTRMAVVTGDYDAMQNVLAKSGFGNVDSFGELELGSETFDIYVGNYDATYSDYPDFESLFEIDNTTGIERIHNYDIVFINCGVWEWDEQLETGNTVQPDADHTIAVLQAYVTNGGRLYATDLAYDYIEQAFPAYIDFHADESTPDAAEALNAAEAGDENVVVDAATLLDTNLATFLRNVNCTALESATCINEDGTVMIEGFLPFWAIMNGAHEGSNASFYIEAEVKSVDYEQPFIKPLTTSFNVGEGRVFFSSYHSENHGSAGLLPQERILQYLIFE